MTEIVFCTCGANEWVGHGSYPTTTGHRPRVRCRSCGAAPSAHRRGEARRQRVDRERYWTRVLRSFPFLRLSAALARVDRFEGVSAGLRTKLVSEVLAGKVEIPRAPYGDERHILLKRCLEVYRTPSPIPTVSMPDLGITVRAPDSELIWHAIWRARGVASLLWVPHRRRFDPDDLRTGQPEPMPSFLDHFASDLDPWRAMYPEVWESSYPLGDGSLRYFLTLSDTKVTATVATRRRVVGEWTETETKFGFGFPKTMEWFPDGEWTGDWWMTDIVQLPGSRFGLEV